MRPRFGVRCDTGGCQGSHPGEGSEIVGSNAQMAASAVHWSRCGSWGELLRLQPHAESAHLLYQWVAKNETEGALRVVSSAGRSSARRNKNDRVITGPQKVDSRGCSYVTNSRTGRGALQGQGTLYVAHDFYLRPATCPVRPLRAAC